MDLPGQSPLVSNAEAVSMNTIHPGAILDNFFYFFINKML